MRFGTAVHALLEAYYKGEADPPRAAAEALTPESPCYASLRGAGWKSPAGRCAMAGLPYLPRPDKCARIVSEGPAVIAGDPPIAGTRDLYVVTEPSEQARLGIATPELVVDFKTSSDPLRYAKTSTELRNDAQGVTYPYSAMVDFTLERVSCRWVYLPSRSPHIGATYTDFVQRRSRVERVSLPRLRDRARRCLQIVRDPAQATANADACRDYGRLCPNHVDAGGICPGTKEIDMGLMAKKIAALRGETTDAPAPEAPAEALAPKRTRKPKAEPAAESKAELDTGDQGFEATITHAYVSDGTDLSVTVELPVGPIVPVGARVRVTVL